MIALIEHGETAVDAQGESHGSRNPSLNAAGRRQAVSLGALMRRASPRPAMIYHSPKLRARQTAQIAGAVAGIPTRVAPSLAPLRSGGLSAGKEPAASRRLIPFFRDGSKPIPGGESVRAWRTRHLRFMRRILATGQPVAMITHSNVVGSVRGGPEAARRAMAAPPRSAQVAVTLTGDSDGQPPHQPQRP